MYYSLKFLFFGCLLIICLSFNSALANTDPPFYCKNGNPVPKNCFAKNNDSGSYLASAFAPEEQECVYYGTSVVQPLVTVEECNENCCADPEFKKKCENGHNVAKTCLEQIPTSVGRGLFRKFGYDQHQGKCVFYETSSSGDMLFKDEKTCMKTCCSNTARKNPEIEFPEPLFCENGNQAALRCHLNYSTVGNSIAASFEQETLTCAYHASSGSDTSLNSFSILDECDQICCGEPRYKEKCKSGERVADRCNQKIPATVSRALFTRYVYNQELGICVKVKTPSHGQMIFSTKAECKEVCCNA